MRAGKFLLYLPLSQVKYYKKEGQLSCIYEALIKADKGTASYIIGSRAEQLEEGHLSLLIELKEIGAISLFRGGEKELKCYLLQKANPGSELFIAKEFSIRPRTL